MFTHCSDSIYNHIEAGELIRVLPASCCGEGGRRITKWLTEEGKDESTFDLSENRTTRQGGQGSIILHITYDSKI